MTGFSVQRGFVVLPSQGDAVGAQACTLRLVCQGNRDYDVTATILACTDNTRPPLTYM